MLHPSQERVKAGHVLLHATSAELSLDAYRLVPDILELSIVKQSLVVRRNGGSKPLKGVLKSEAGLGGRSRHGAGRDVGYGGGAEDPPPRSSMKSGVGVRASITTHAYFWTFKKKRAVARRVMEEGWVAAHSWPTMHRIVSKHAVTCSAPGAMIDWPALAALRYRSPVPRKTLKQLPTC
jgi:hypothetical protein